MPRKELHSFKSSHKPLRAMHPFDPDAEFEDLVCSLNEAHVPGSITSGKTRNELIRAWALFAGRERCEREFMAALKRSGSRTALARQLSMSPSTLSAFETFFSSLSERYTRPKDGAAFRKMLDLLTAEEQLPLAGAAADALRDPALLKRLSSASGGNITRLLETALRAVELRRAVEQLRNLLANDVVDERSYQTWCDTHSWAFGGTHRARDQVRRVDADSIVDLLLPDVSGYRDIVELKRPDAQVLSYDRSHNTHYFSREASKAIAQTHKYMDRLHSLAQRGLENHPHIIAYHPRATIVIGRSDDWGKAKVSALRGLNERLHSIHIITYDLLLSRAETILQTLEVRTQVSKVASSPNTRQLRPRRKR